MKTRFLGVAFAFPLTVYILGPVFEPSGFNGGDAVAQTAQWDFGDAPLPYPSTLGANGARHIDTSAEWLGSTLPLASPLACNNLTTTEADAKVGNQDNDDGLAGWWFNPVTGTLFATVMVSAGAPSGPRYLNALIDLNQDGDWADSQEWSVRNLPLDLPSARCSLLVSVTLGTRPPPIPAPGFSTWGRFTLTRAPIPGTPTNPWVGTGEFASGETEDYDLTWAPHDGPPPGGVSPPRFELLEFTLKCSPKNKTILHGDTQNFVLSTEGNIKPNHLMVLNAGCVGCDPGAIWAPSPGSMFSVAPGVDLLGPPPALPGLFPSLTSKDVHQCRPASECAIDFLAWYFNADPAGGQVGAAASLGSCKCSVLHEPPAAPLGTGTLKATVTDQDGNPVVGAIVEVLKEGITIARSATSESGKSKIKKIPAGPAIVESFFDVFVEIPAQKPVDIAADAVTKAKLTLQRPAEIIGRAIGKDKSGIDLPPPRFFDITLVVDPTNPNVVFVGRSSKEGDFASGPIIPGIYLVIASGDGFKKAEKQVTVKAGEKLRVDLNPIQSEEQDFALSVDPNSLTIQRGSSGMSDVTIQSVCGFNRQVSLDCLPSPVGLNCSFNPEQVTPPANGSVVSRLTVSVAADSPEGTRTLEVKGTADGVTRSRTLSFTVTPQPPLPDFSISANPFVLTIQQGDFGTSTVTVTSLNGFVGLVGLSCENAPPGVTCGFDPNLVAPSPGFAKTSGLTINVAVDTLPQLTCST